MLDQAPYDCSVVAAQLVEAACCLQGGDGEAAKAHVAHAMRLIHGQSNSVLVIHGTRSKRARSVIRGGLAAWQARRLTAHVDAHLAGRIHIEDLAAFLGLSVGHFCRAFKSSFGLSPHAWLTRRRIEFAQGLMLRTREPLGAIALYCGMSDQSHFSRLFRRIVGETPYQWRRIRTGALEEHATASTIARLAVPSVRIDATAS